MTKDMKRLLRELDLPDGCPSVDTKAVKRRVNTLLNADPSERKAYMRQKIKFAALLVAATIALCGTTLAVAQNLDVLTVWFEGDTSAAEGLVDREKRSVGTEDYTFTVDSSVSDEAEVYLLLTIEGKTPQGLARLKDHSFHPLDGLHIKPVWADPSKAPAPTPAPTGGGGAIITMPDGSSVTVGESPDSDYERPIDLDSYSMASLNYADTDTTQAYRFRGALPEGATGLRIWLEDMEDQAIEVPITPAESLVLSLDATGAGAGWFDNTGGEPVTLTQVRVTPFSMRLLFTHSPEQPDVYPPVLLRLEDGTLYTASQLAVRNTGGSPVLVEGVLREGFVNFHFHSVMDPEQIKGVVAFGREYPMDGGPSVAVEVDPKLLPFSLPMALDSQGSEGVPVRALCDALGADCRWDNATQSATLTYRDTTLVLTLDNGGALVNGEISPYYPLPFALEGKLYVQPWVLADAFKIQIDKVHQRPGQTEAPACNVAP